MNTLTKYWFLEDFNLFRKIGRLNMMRICNILEMDHFSKGDVISLNARESDSVFFLKKGTVKIVDSADNTAKYLVKKGHIFGELVLYDKVSALHEQAIALEDTIVCYIEAGHMQKIMEKHRSLKNGVLKIYGLRIRKLERRLKDLLYKDSGTRIREFIVDYVKEHGQLQGSRISAKNLLSHKDIANLTNTSRQTVSNVLSKMRKDELLDYNAHYLSIPINLTWQLDESLDTAPSSP